MANLPETSTWDAGVYQLEATDLVQGGAGAVDNVQAQALVDRTLYLKNWVQASEDESFALAFGL